MKLLILNLLIFTSQIIFAQNSTLIYEINGRRTIAEEDYIKRAIKEHYNSEKENIQNNIEGIFGYDIELSTIIMPENISVKYLSNEADTSLNMEIYFEEDLIIEFDWEGCTARGTFGDIQMNMNVSLHHLPQKYDYSLVINNINISSIDIDIDAWADLWYQFWNHVACPAVGEISNTSMSFISDIIIGYFNEVSTFLSNSPELINPINHLLAINYELIEDEDIEDLISESFPLDLNIYAENENLIISVEFYMGISANPNLFTNFEPDLVTNTQFDLVGFSFLDYQLQNAFNWIPNLNVPDRVNIAFDIMDKDILIQQSNFDFPGYRIEAKWGKIQSQIFTENDIVYNEITDDVINEYKNSTFWDQPEIDLLKNIINNGYSRGFIPFMAVGIGHYDHSPKIGNNYIEVQNTNEDSDFSNITKELYLYNLKLHAHAVIREFADLISVWQIENELNAAGIAHKMNWWRAGEDWLEEEFRDNIIAILSEAVRIEDPTAKIIHPFHVFNLANSLDSWKDEIDIIGVNAYPNHFTALPNMGFLIGDFIWSVRRATTALGIGDKPVWLTETGYPAIEVNDSEFDLNLVNDFYNFTESRQSEYIEDAFNSAMEAGANRFYYFALTMPEDSMAVENEDNMTFQYSGLIRRENNSYAFKSSLSDFNETVINKYLGISEITLNINSNSFSGAKISIKDHVDNQNSGVTIPVLKSKQFTAKVKQEYLNNEKHINWDNDFNKIKLEYEFIANFESIEYIGNYEPIYQITFVNDISIRLQDPWYVREDGTQTGTDWIEIDDGIYNVFLEQNAYFEEDIPIYRLRTDRFYIENNNIYEFSHWSGDGINYSDSTNTVTAVVFLESGATAEPIYEAVNLIPNHTIHIPEDEVLSIPSGANISLADGVTLQVSGTLTNTSIPYGEKNTLVLSNGAGIVKTETGSIILEDVEIISETGAFIELNYDELNNSLSRFKRTLFNNIDINILASASNVNNQFHATNFTQCTMAYSPIHFLVDDYSVHDINIRNSIIFESNNSFFERDLDYDFSIRYSDIYNSNIIEYAEYLSLNDNIFDNPQFVNFQSGDFNLQSTSPCIDSGNLSSHYDPDGTVADMGAFYFNQCTTIGDVNCDDLINIADILIIVDHILGSEQLQSPQSENADINNDGFITVTDVLEIINILIEGNLAYSNPEITYLSGAIEAMEDGQRYKYNIDMLNEQDVYILHFKLQFENKIPLNVMKGLRSNDMTVSHVYKEDDYTLNIMVFSPEGRKITPGYGTILEIELESTGLGRDGDLTDGSEFIITNLANNPETLIPVEIVSADELSRLAEIQPSSLPTEYNLYSVYPNPFNPTTNITYELPEDSFITIAVYNLAGRKVDELVSGLVQSGRYNITWNAEQFSSGVYFVTMLARQGSSGETTPNFSAIQKVVLLK